MRSGPAACLASLADAGHMLTDAAGLSMAPLAAPGHPASDQPPHPGVQRAEIRSELQQLLRDW